MRQTIFLLYLWACSLLAGHAQEADEANYDESKIPPLYPARSVKD